MPKISGRQLLAFFGAGIGTAVLTLLVRDKIFGNIFDIADAAEVMKLTPVRLPHPLPIYQQQSSFLPTARSKERLKAQMPTLIWLNIQ